MRYKEQSLTTLLRVCINVLLHVANQSRGRFTKIKSGYIFHHTYSIQLQEWLNSGIQEVEEEEEVGEEGAEEEVGEVE